MKTSRALAVLVLGLWALACRAEDIEPLDADFLEYLAALESEEGDWTEVADELSEPTRCEPAAKRDCEKEEAAQPAAKQR